MEHDRDRFLTTSGLMIPDISSLPLYKQNEIKTATEANSKDISIHISHDSMSSWISNQNTSVSLLIKHPVKVKMQGMRQDQVYTTAIMSPNVVSNVGV